MTAVLIVKWGVARKFEEATGMSEYKEGGLTTSCRREVGDGRFGEAEIVDHPGSPLPGTLLLYHLQRGPTMFTKEAFPIALKGLLTDPNSAKVRLHNSSYSSCVAIGEVVNASTTL